MVLVHLVPSAAGVLLSFKNLNTFTFSQLFGAPWYGLENYAAILFDEANPLHSGFTGAARNTAIYTAATVGGTLVGGLGVALLLNREFTGRRVVRTLMLAPYVVPSFVVAVLWGFMFQSDSGVINRVLVDVLGISRRAAGVAAGPLAAGHHHPQHLAGDPAGDAHLPRGPAVASHASCTRRPRSTARARCAASATSPCRCCAR